MTAAIGTGPGRPIPRRALLRGVAAAAVLLGAGPAAGQSRPTVTVHKSPT